MASTWPLCESAMFAFQSICFSSIDVIKDDISYVRRLVNSVIAILKIVAKYDFQTERRSGETNEK